METKKLKGKQVTEFTEQSVQLWNLIESHWNNTLLKKEEVTKTKLPTNSNTFFCFSSMIDDFEINLARIIYLYKCFCPVFSFKLLVLQWIVSVSLFTGDGFFSIPRKFCLHFSFHLPLPPRMRLSAAAFICIPFFVCLFRLKILLCYVLALESDGIKAYNFILNTRMSCKRRDSEMKTNSIPASSYNNVFCIMRNLLIIGVAH